MSNARSPSRRTFLSLGAATAAATVWVPRRVHGYTTVEVAARLENGVGMSKWDLDTPALCVDLDRLERNIATMQAAAKRFGIATRPHAKTHKSADIAKLQLAAGAIGICTAKLGEAEALMAQGIDRICMTTSNLSPAKIRRAMQLRKKSAEFIQATDTEENARAPVGRRPGGGRDRRRRDRRRGRHPKRHPARRGRRRAREARGHAAQPEAPRPALLRRRRPAHHRLRDAQGAHARQHRAPTCGSARR